MADKISTSYQMIGASAEEGKTKMRGDRGGDGGRGATDKREWKKGKKMRKFTAISAHSRPPPTAGGLSQCLWRSQRTGFHPNTGFRKNSQRIPTENVNETHQTV